MTMVKEEPKEGGIREPLCAALPPELWIRILSFHSDLVHLWLTCRAVSQELRAYVEQVFADTHIKNTFIDFQLERYNLGGKTRRPEIPTSFERFSADRNRALAYFRDKRDEEEVAPIQVAGSGGPSGRIKAKGKHAIKYQMVMDRWQENIRNIRPELPNYTIEVDGCVNDTPLQHIHLDIQRREIGFDWRAMFQLFYKEQKRITILRKQWKTEVDARSGQSLIVAPDARKQARRERLKSRYASDEDRLWALNSLAFYEEHYVPEGRPGVALTVPGAGLGERFFGNIYLVQSMWLDEWSCLQRIGYRQNLIEDCKEQHRAIQHTPLVPPTPEPSVSLPSNQTRHGSRRALVHYL